MSEEVGVGGEVLLSRAELAGRYRVARSTIARALSRAQQMHDKEPGRWPAPPQPVNPGGSQPRYRADEMDQWWPRRPARGRPVKAGDAR